MFILEFILVMLNPRRVVLISRGPCELKHHRSRPRCGLRPPVASVDSTDTERAREPEVLYM